MERRNRILIFNSIIVAHLLLLAGLKFTAWPEMLGWPYLFLEGWLPYRDIAIAHTPILLAKLAIFYKIFGVGILQLKIFTWVLIITTDLLLFWVVTKIWNRKVAFLSLVSFVFFQVLFDGNGLWFDMLMGPFVFVSYYFIHKKNWIWAGVFWALAFLSKQTAFWFLLPILLEVFTSKNKERQENLKYISFGAIGVFLVFVLVLLFLKLLPDFYYWAVNFGIFILPKAQGQIQMPGLKNILVATFPFAIFLPFFFISKRKEKSLLVWSVMGAMSALPRFEYFHFQPALPFLAIASGVLFLKIKTFSKFLKIFLVFYFLGMTYLFVNYFLRNWGEGVRFYERDVQEVADYIRSNTAPGEKIFITNWWDNVYALSGTLPATSPLVPQLEWYQNLPGIQDKEVEDLSANAPKMILIQPYSKTGLSSYIPETVYQFIKLNYKFKERVDGMDVLVPVK